MEEETRVEVQTKVNKRNKKCNRDEEKRVQIHLLVQGPGIWSYVVLVDHGKGGKVRQRQPQEFC